MTTMTTRVVGRVKGRTLALVFVTDDTGTDTRVMWQAKYRNGHPRGYRCDEHGPSTGPDDGCAHTAAAARALRAQREAEHRASRTPTPGEEPLSGTRQLTGGEGSEVRGERMGSTTAPSSGGGEPCRGR